jgi:hypothetical protein
MQSPGRRRNRLRISPLRSPHHARKGEHLPTTTLVLAEAIAQPANVAGNGFRVADHGEVEVRKCIAGSMGARSASTRGVQRQRPVDGRNDLKPSVGRQTRRARSCQRDCRVDEGSHHRQHRKLQSWEHESWVRSPIEVLAARNVGRRQGRQLLILTQHAGVQCRSGPTRIKNSRWPQRGFKVL